MIPADLVQVDHLPLGKPVDKARKTTLVKVDCRLAEPSRLTMQNVDAKSIVKREGTLL
jgi:hypothetical protein